MAGPQSEVSLSRSGTRRSSKEPSDRTLRVVFFTVARGVEEGREGFSGAAHAADDVRLGVIGVVKLVNGYHSGHALDGEGHAEVLRVASRPHATAGEVHDVVGSAPSAVEDEPRPVSGWCELH